MSSPKFKQELEQMPREDDDEPFDMQAKTTNGPQLFSSKPINKPWVEKEEIALLDAFTEQVSDDPTTTVKEFWQAISDKLSVLNINKSGSSCNTRFNKFKSGSHFLHDKYVALNEMNESRFSADEIPREPSQATSEETAASGDPKLSVIQFAKWTQAESTHLSRCIREHLESKEKQGVDPVINWAVIEEEYNAHGFNRSVTALKAKWNKLRTERSAAETKQPSRLSTTLNNVQPKFAKRARTTNTASVMDGDSGEGPQAGVKRPRTIEQQREESDIPNRAGPVSNSRYSNAESQSRGAVNEAHSPCRRRSVIRSSRSHSVLSSMPGPGLGGRMSLREELMQVKRDIVEVQMKRKVQKEELRRIKFEADMIKTKLKALQEEREELQSKEESLNEELADTDALLRSLEEEEERLLSE